MDELNRLADDYEWFLQANALGVIRRKGDQGDREASFQPRGQYLFEVEPGSGEWLQIGNEFAIRSNGLPPYYREQVIAAVLNRLASMGAHQLLMLAALMRHYQLRVYEPRLEVDETGAQLPSPSLPNITARRLFDAWFRRAGALDPTIGPAQVDAALATIGQWTEQVAGSASDAYSWEVERPVDKRLIKAEFLASDERAAHALERRAAPQAHLQAARYKVFVNGAQRGPYTADDIGQQLARGELDAGTRVWNMQWNPKLDKWQTIGGLPELAVLLGAAIPDPDDQVPDPE
jgi:hypothetical protein